MFCDHHDGERESWMLCIVCLPGVSCLFCGYSFQCHGFVCSLWLWYFPIILTYYFWVSFMRTAMAFCTFAWSSLSLRPSSKFLCCGSNGDWMPVCASSEGSGESAHLHRLTLVIVTVQNLLCCLKWRFVINSRQQRILWWVCIFAQAKSLDNAISIKITCAGSEGSWEFASLHRLALAFVLRYSIEISCAGWNGDFCNVYVNSECCGESALATTSLLCNHQCVVSMRQKNAPSVL